MTKFTFGWHRAKYTFGWHRPNGQDGEAHLVIMRNDHSIPGCKPPSEPFKGAFPWEYNWLIDTERSNIALANQRKAAAITGTTSGGEEAP